MKIALIGASGQAGSRILSEFAHVRQRLTVGY
ncbi:putative NADH-flavin reductase [Rhizobium lentis]|uniref:Putative NADH-flavin reductase n=1 Tax=Rhizobium lentis TaxID=1138194 RepID=A0A7W8UL71_9HYPH|nr:putative NADH-flavin reductase [Rhizobium lentis]MBB5549968.1 putative NADH-flavin reductase [Rhizobium lentis]MBB5560024.1 putative NADH-flavin reductase [Rhizobium lentis]MBB5567088.1 putative NADH-flavin reductase [Rhizobium lentis]